MKKHKSVVAILLAVMMIFTMMPMMAFADTPAANVASWTDYAEKIIDTNGNKFDTTRTFINSDGYGYVSAVGKDDKSVQGDYKIAPPEAVAFYDFDNASLVFGDANTALDKSSWKQSSFQALTTINVKMTEPSYCEGYDAKAPKSVVIPVNRTELVDEDGEPTGKYVWEGFAGPYTISLEQSEYVPASEKDQTVTFTASVKLTNKLPSGTVIGIDVPDKYGVPAKATVTVKGEDKTPRTANIYLDAANDFSKASFNGGVVFGFYDGDAHTVVTDTVPGYSVSYEIYNAETGKYTAATNVSITDVPEEGKETVFKVVYTDNKTSTPLRSEDITLTLVPAMGAHVGFKVLDREDGAVYSVDGSEYNAASYVGVEADVLDEYSSDADRRAIQKLYEAANAKAVAKNEAEIMKYFNELYQISEEVSKYNPDSIDLKIDAKDLTKQEKDAIEKTYGTLLNNIASIKADENTETIKTTAEIFLNGKDPHDYTVEFTKAVDKKVFKGKKFIKKGKLKKNGTIALKAECANGYTVKYKLSNANSKIVINKKTGKITCKKGLAKGTYKVKVTAYVPRFTDTPLAMITSETQTVVIKVNKK